MKHILFLSYLILLASCSSDNSTEKNSTIKTQSKAQESINAEINAIDQEVSNSGQEASSLSYSKESGESIVVRAHLNDKGELLKLEEEYNEGISGKSGINSFYYRNKKIIASRERFEDKKTKEKAQFVELLSFYSEKGEVYKTLEKRVNYEEDLETVPYNEIAIQITDISRAERALNQQGEFETTFQGFVEAQALRYIVVGSAKSGFTSAIRINSEDDFIRFISVNEKKYLNRKVKISFEHVIDPTGFQYQSYIQGSFVE
jgi:hypothetical protein